MQLERLFRPMLTMALFGVIIGFPAWSHAEEEAPVVLRPEALKWVSSPSLHGLQTVSLIGDPAVAAPYVERIRIPAHARLEPHFHPNAARKVTVLSGTFYFGYGEQFLEGKLQELPVGSFFTEPAGMAHYAMTKDEPVVLELHAIGPASTHYVKKPLAAAKAADAKTEIEALLAQVGSLDGAVFLRNGTEYKAQEAVAHFRLKWERQAAQVKTADDFIELCGAKSVMSGTAYQIRFADGRIVECASLLRERLAVLRK